MRLRIPGSNQPVAVAYRTVEGVRGIRSVLSALGRGATRCCSELPAFRLYKILNEVQSVSRDKVGANCSVLILEVLWLLEDKNFEHIDRLSDTLSNYAKRHLRNRTSRRSLLFVQMIQIMIRTDYDAAKTRSKADRYFRQLKSLHPSMIEGAIDSREVLPYERL